MNDSLHFPAIDLAREPRFALGGLEVRPSTRELAAGGVSEVVEPRIMQVLVALARRRGQVVSRDELITACWGGRAVGEDAINRCIQAIRRIAQGHGAFKVTTVARVGYRLDESALPFARPAPVSSRRPVTPTPERERRHLTVLSCSLVRPSGAVADPEEWHAQVTRFRSAVKTATERFGGYLADLRGDHLEVVYGYPQAQEDATDRALRAGLAIIEAVGGASAHGSADAGATEAHDFGVRIGLHAGNVMVVRQGDDIEMFGEAMDIARLVRIQAERDTLVVTDVVRNGVSQGFSLEPAADLTAGGGQPVRLFRTVAADPAAADRFRLRETTPFVGREDELRLLSTRWDRVADSDGQFVLVTGEPGIGKSRLLDEFKARAVIDRGRRMEGRGAQLFSNTPFHPVVDLLRQGMGWRDEDTPSAKLGRLQRALEPTGLILDEAVPLIADLIGAPVDDAYPRLDFTPEERRRRLLATLVEWVFAATRDGPLLLVVEDLHWIDPSSLELLQTLAEQGAKAPLLMVCTARPEFRAPWPARAHHAHINLGGLNTPEMRRLLKPLIARAGLATGAESAVIGRADGVPLFAEALAELMGDEARPGSGASQNRGIPATLLNSLAARLDRLGPARSVAQVGAVLGREFTYDMLQSVAPMPEPELRAALTSLADAELIHERGLPPHARYQFRHALIQDAAYAGLARGERQSLHGTVARMLTARFGAQGGPEVIARHWTEAGEGDKAITAWSEAATEAAARRAYQEAAAAHRQALAILRAQPETPNRDVRELDIGIALVIILQELLGSHAPETVALTARNRELAEKGGFVGATTGMRTLLFAQAMMEADWPRAQALADQLSDFAEQVGGFAEPTAATFARAMAHFTGFNAGYYRGELETAERQYEPWQDLHEAEGFDQRMSATMGLCNGAQLALHRGYADLARARMARAQAWSLKAGSPFDRAAALVLDALLQVMLRAPAQAEALAVEGLALADEGGFPQAGGWARCVLGWAQAHGGAAAQGVASIEDGLARLTEAQVRISRPHFTTLLAEAQALNGAHDEAFASFELALTVNPEERIYRPHTLVCRGEFLARLGQVDQALTSFNAAVAAARSVGSRTVELRATAGQARGLMSRGAAGEARARLAACLEGFTEGFDTFDLAAATALSEALTARA